MIRIQTELGVVKLVQNILEIPTLRGKQLFCDLETTSGDPNKEAFNPYMGDRICGIAILVDDDPEAWYLPIRHKEKSWNLPVDQVLEFMRELFGNFDDWINHNLKFDAHFFSVENVVFDPIRMLDTLNMAKLLNSDRMTHDLKDLCRGWVKLKMEDEAEIHRYLYDIRSKDYGDLPGDMCGKYAGMDVFGNRALYRLMQQAMPKKMADIWEREILLTPVLFDMEAYGLRVNERHTKQEGVKTLTRILEIRDRILEMLGIVIVDSSKCMYDIFCVQLGLPVVAKTKITDKGGGGGPSFDKEAMLKYCSLPQVVTNPFKKEVVNLIQEWKIETTFFGLFINTLLEKNIAGIVHPRIKQSVRTGRMAYSDPNSQQWNERAKALIIPRKGCSFICADASQMEFRVIVHYCKIMSAIEAYAKKADTDYHNLVAEMCGVKRKPAKTLNFAVAFGAQKKRVTSELSKDETIIELVSAELAKEEGLSDTEKVAKYQYLIALRSSEFYDKYHKEFPEIGRTSELAKELCARDGYIEDKYGRRRHIPYAFRYKAFNGLIQMCAMNIIKSRMLALAPRYNKKMRDWKIILLCNVHDELLFEGPTEVMERKEVQDYIKTELEKTDKDFRVPFVWDMGISDKNWKEAKP